MRAQCLNFDVHCCTNQLAATSGPLQHTTPHIATCTGLSRNSLNKCPTSAHLELPSNHTPNTVFVCTQLCMHFTPVHVSSLYNADSLHVCARLHLHAGNCGTYCIKQDIYIQACTLTAHTNGDLLLTWPPSSYIV